MGLIWFVIGFSTGGFAFYHYGYAKGQDIANKQWWSYKYNYHFKKVNNK